MSNRIIEDDLEMLRLIKAFQKITDQDTRRMILLYVDEQLEKRQAKVPESPSR
ncbi:hypothetical protein [Bradyrhizobium sp. CCBAU 11386]|uniref:hypothetical protein n=1 Tax=Bradyrhizobium sp. CCBAU 11386 TaxID=1630837 RepID=UPI0023038D80|nr:hypothetical protein [Bradyrhizobium sp. CCBAU 11386]